MSNSNSVVSVRIPDSLLEVVDKWCEVHHVNRTAAINYLLTKGLIKEGFLDKE